MPFTKEKRREYDRQRLGRSGGRVTHRDIQSSIDETKKKYFQTRLPIQLIGRLQRMQAEAIAVGKYPWRTMADLVAAMINRGLLSMQGDPLVDEMIPLIQLETQFEAVSQVRKQSHVALSRARTEIGALLDIKDADGALNYYHVTMDAVRELPPTSWREWLIRELTAAFPQLAKQKPRGVRLTHTTTTKAQELRDSRARARRRANG